MENNRIQQLKTLSKQSPDDPFSPYALALEYEAAGDLDSAEYYFKFLIHTFPDYIPGYYQFALFCSNHSDKVKAHELLKKGMEKARLSGDQKTLNEMKMLNEEIED